MLFFAPVLISLPVPIEYAYNLNLIGTVFLNIMFISMFISASFSTYKKKELRHLSYITIVVSFVLYFSVLGEFKAQIVKEANGIKEITITMKDNSIFNTKNIFFIDQTKDYLFLYNILEEHSIVINKNEISKFTIKKRIDF